MPNRPSKVILKSLELPSGAKKIPGVLVSEPILPEDVPKELTRHTGAINGILKYLDDEHINKREKVCIAIVNGILANPKRCEKKIDEIARYAWRLSGALTNVMKEEGYEHS